MDLPPIDLEEIPEQDWVRLTQAQFEPIRINERLWIVPSWHTPPDPSAINLELDPGLAFGTGSHPTTRLCLEWLCANTPAGGSLLDYGCGSGILAIAAAKLGAAEVVGVDIDPKALEAAADNAARNQVALRLQHTAQALPQQFDVVVANILTNPLCVLAPALCAHLGSGARIALSGVLAPQAEQVIAAYAPWVQLAVGGSQEGWVRLEGRRCS
jgi:ribosomal protein L11 methyltransferase